ncbi:MAG: cob(I)yrinic acid a,c-diamide adenosyltransferase [Bryobacterales bacterium]|nr:cob(I)yrinic acid a,c-diamide adenosyltransferase [Bryobacterales bacterium]
MSAKPYNEPKLTLSRIYTRGGDMGETSLVNGRRVGKDDLKIDAYGTVDELSAFLGQARVSAIAAGLEPLAAILLRVQHELFNLGSILATDPGKEHPAQPRVTAADVAQLETEIDAMNAELPTLRSFVLPGSSALDAQLHVARTVCRRAERLLVALRRVEPVDETGLRYLNRLSDALFVWGRWSSVKLGLEEVLWSPNAASSGAKAQTP